MIQRSNRYLDGNCILGAEKVEGIMGVFLKEAIKEAQLGLSQGGIPIGSVLVIDNKIVSRGHNRRVQKNSAILHAEMDCIENAG